MKVAAELFFQKFDIICNAWFDEALCDVGVRSKYCIGIYVLNWWTMKIYRHSNQLGTFLEYINKQIELILKCPQIRHINENSKYLLQLIKHSEHILTISNT